jgi:hypothetical protein
VVELHFYFLGLLYRPLVVATSFVTLYRGETTLELPRSHTYYVYSIAYNPMSVGNGTDNIYIHKELCIHTFVYTHNQLVYIRFYARLLLLFICKMMISIVIFIKNIKIFSSMEPQSRDTYAHTQYNPEISPTQTEKWLNAPVAHLGFEFDSQYE